MPQNHFTAVAKNNNASTKMDAENMLREIAYVLALTRRVREEILADRQEPELAGV